MMMIMMMVMVTYAFWILHKKCDNTTMTLVDQSKSTQDLCDHPNSGLPWVGSLIIMLEQLELRTEDQACGIDPNVLHLKQMWPFSSTWGLIPMASIIIYMYFYTAIISRSTLGNTAIYCDVLWQLLGVNQLWPYFKNWA